MQPLYYAIGAVVIALVVFFVARRKVSAAKVPAAPSAAQPAAPAAPAPAPTPAPAPAPAPAAPAAPDLPVNPFVAWKAEGRSLEWIQTFGGHPMAEADWPLAVAAGYERPAAPAASGPGIDTSAPTLDFVVVGGGVPINLNCAKRVVNCPPSVRVAVNQASGQTGATNTFDVTVNDTIVHGWQVGNEFTATVTGPVVTVSVSCPGLQMLIKSA